MTAFQPRNPEFAERVRDSFARQPFMQTIGAELARVEPGTTEIHLPFGEGVTQQHGYFHGGVIGTLADTACGYAVFSLLAPEDSGLTIEFKVNILAPGAGDRLIGVGTVLRPGRNISVAEARIHAETGAPGSGERKLCATALVTLMVMKGMTDDKQVRDGRTA